MRVNIKLLVEDLDTGESVEVVGEPSTGPTDDPYEETSALAGEMLSKALAQMAKAKKTA